MDERGRPVSGAAVRMWDKSYALCRPLLDSGLTDERGQFRPTFSGLIGVLDVRVEVDGAPSWFVIDQRDLLEGDEELMVSLEKRQEAIEILVRDADSHALLSGATVLLWGRFQETGRSPG